MLIANQKLTSSFSHADPLHFTFNIFALHYFGIPVIHHLGWDQFLAFYLIGGLFALNEKEKRKKTKDPRP